MRQDLAESFATDIERNELRECAERLNRYRILAAASHGPEREQLLGEAEAAEAELKEWNVLAALVRAAAKDPVLETSDGLVAKEKAVS